MQYAIAINDELTITTEQVTPEQLHQAAQTGFKSVLNLRSPEETGFLTDEADRAQEAGLQYAHLPVNPTAIDETLVCRVVQQIADLPKPALLHCASGMRAGLMASLYVAYQQDLNVEQMLKMAQNLGLHWPKQPAFRQVCDRAA